MMPYTGNIYNTFQLSIMFHTFFMLQLITLIASITSQTAIILTLSTAFMNVLYGSA